MRVGGGGQASRYPAAMAASPLRVGSCLLLLVVSWLLAAAVRVQEEDLLIRKVGDQTSSSSTWTRVEEEVDSNLITALPGAPEVPFSMSSGYITVDEAAGRALFYWFVEANLPDPDSAPLTLWLNGGPGCSSVGGGMLSELGPFFPNKDGKTLQVNPYSWNLVSNLLFLESPAGVGFSYSNTTSDYKTGDDETALDSYVFLRKFLVKYPRFAASQLYIAGESYAGHYVPQLAQLILRKNKVESVQIRLQGIAIGNAWTDAAIDNLGAAFYWWSHALVSDETFYGIADACNLSVVGPLAVQGNERDCIRYLDSADREMGPINIYEIYVDVCLSWHARKEVSQFARQMREAGVASGRPLLRLEATDSYDPCVDDEVEAYLNIPEVQKALHANTTGIRWRWTDCSYVVSYSRPDFLQSIIPVYRELLATDLQILIYSGDTDAIVPVTGSRHWIASLERDILAKWRPYYVNHQVGGYVTVYDRLTFATVRGAGHMVPYTQPNRALHLFRSFIQNRAF